jgi:hypothetical protein
MLETIQQLDKLAAAMVNFVELGMLLSGCSPFFSCLLPLLTVAQKSVPMFGHFQLIALL